MRSNCIFSLLLVYYLLHPFANINAQLKTDSLLALLRSAKEDTVRANTLNNLSASYRVVSNYPKARLYADSAMQLSKLLGFKKGIGFAFYNLGVVDESTNNYKMAFRNYSEAVAIGKEINNKKLLAGAYQCMGNLSHIKGNLEEAMRLYKNSVEISKEMGDQVAVANALTGIGTIYRSMGNATEALRHYEECIAIGKKYNDKRVFAYANGNAGIVYQSQGNYVEALNRYLASLKASEELGDKYSISICYNQIGIVRGKMGNYDDAINSYKASLAISEAIGDQHGKAVTYCNIGAALRAQGKQEEALKYYETSVDIRKAIGDKQGLASSLSNIGLILSSKGNYQEALQNYMSCLELTKSTGDRFGQVNSFVNIADAYMKMQQFDASEKYFDSSLLASKKIGSKELLRNVYAGRAKLDSLRGNYKGAYENFRMATIYRDSIINKENTEKMVKLQMQYDFSKKEDSLKYQQAITSEQLKQQSLLSRQQAQSLILKENELELTMKAKEIQDFEFMRTQFELASEQGRRQQNDKQLLIAEQEKALQRSRLNLQASQLQLQHNEIRAGKAQRNILLAGSMLLLLAIFLLYRNVKHQRSIRRLERTAAEKEKIALQLQSLRAQLNPHFMFNSLNAIQELIVTEKNELSQSYLERFAMLLRMMLENATQPFIPLYKELNFLELYLSLEKLRLPDLHYSIEVGPGLEDEGLTIPNMILQPYVENALWHGLQHKHGAKELKLYVWSTNGTIRFEIKDNGIGRKKAAELKSLYRKGHNSKGMELLSKRFAILSKELGRDIHTRITDIIEGNEIKGTMVEISVPLNRTGTKEIAEHDTYHHH